MRVALMALPAIPGALAEVAEHWLYLLVTLWFALISLALWYRTREHKLERRRDRLLREELEAYARLDAILPPGGDARAFAKRICRTISDKSAFRRSALLLRNAEGRLYVAGSAGMDDLAVAALADWAAQAAWGKQTSEQQSGTAAHCGTAAHSGQLHSFPQEANPGRRASARSFLLGLPAQNVSEGPEGPDQDFYTDQNLYTLPVGRATLHDLDGRAVLLPLRTPAGSLTGALAVSPDADLPPWTPNLAEALSPLETLAGRLARALDSAAVAERLVRSEKLAAAQAHAAQFGSGVARELTHPLTAVLGFAELIAATAAEPRVRDDARSITAEALRMKAILQTHLPPDMPGLDKHAVAGAALREIA
jgi:hypothetical protein